MRAASCPIRVILGHGLLDGFNQHHIIQTKQGAIVVGRFDFTGDGMDIPYNTLRAANRRRAKKKTESILTRKKQAAHSSAYSFEIEESHPRRTPGPILLSIVACLM